MYWLLIEYKGVRGGSTEVSSGGGVQSAIPLQGGVIIFPPRTTDSTKFTPNKVNKGAVGHESYPLFQVSFNVQTDLI